MKRALIISGGDFSPIDNKKYDLIIACDKGYSYALKMNISPDIVIGDFDSYNGEISKDLKTITLPKVKDDTDTMYAIKYALENGYKDITVCCAFGGRLDHTYANIQSAAYISEKGGFPHFIGKNTELYMINNSSITLPKLDGHSLSVFSYSEKCKGVSMEGLKYELLDDELSNSFPLGVSNEWIDDNAWISVKSGLLCIIISSK